MGAEHDVGEMKVGLGSRVEIARVYPAGLDLVGS